MKNYCPIHDVYYQNGCDACAAFAPRVSPSSAATTNMLVDASMKRTADLSRRGSDQKRRVSDHYGEYAKLAALEAFALAMLDPEMYAHAMTVEVRNHARRALGLTEEK